MHPHLQARVFHCPGRFLTSGDVPSLYYVQVTQCNTVYQQQCQTVDDGYYETRCRTQVTQVTSTDTGADTSISGVQEDGCQYRWEGKGDNMRWELIPGTCNNANSGINNNARFGNIGLGVSAGINLGVNAGINLGFNGAGSSSGDNCERRWISKPR